ncbi:hypothetical protein OJ997_19820 [Solirubrobacter phytolaccae]|uniref:Uncharacterized protein n=1 Tax=Solirubrobacter phytolaccae TaxID=1404360 RepID=A0A9X3S9E8_9ACTN|nr:hypothetical protein [Solirubrobacter phytolaccae]MDA0182568.1 hypothetical protein [Solirubrobacter phytolaccae]
MVEEDGEVAEGEVVDGLPVVTDAGVVQEPAPAGALSVPGVQAAALAATGFVAGAATVAVVKRHRSKKAAKKRKSGPLGEIVGSNSFLIDVHLLRRN